MTFTRQLSWAFCGLLVVTWSADLASAQQRGGGMRGQQSRTRYELSTLPEVQSELKLSDDQKKLATDLLAKQREKRASSNQGNFQAMREELAKMNAEFDAQFVATLNDTQKARMNGLLAQVNGAASLLDPEIAKSLKLSDELITKLKAANQSNLAARREAMQGLQDLSQEQRQEKMTNLATSESKALLAVLSEEQVKKFEELKGPALTIDQSPLRTPRNRAQ